MHQPGIRTQLANPMQEFPGRRLMALPLWCGLLLSVVVSGCATPALQKQIPEIESADIPRELDKVVLPTYRVEPPDILLIEAIHNVRPETDVLRSGDQIIIRVSNTLPLDPEGSTIENEFKVINNVFSVETNGQVDLGPIYGTVKLEGLTFEQAKVAISKHLTETAGLTAPQVSMSLPSVAGKQSIAGEHLVRPDGTVSLGVYGSYYVAGKSLDEIKVGLEEFLSADIDQPEVHVDVIAYNSKVYYVITDGGGSGEQVVRLPFTGNETVLDAIANVNGLSTASSKKVWVARPAPAGTEYAQNMAVDYRAISQDAITSTNYQILPGDRVYIKADSLVALDILVAKVTAPLERIASFSLLGLNTVRRFQQPSSSFGNSGGGVF